MKVLSATLLALIVVGVTAVRSDDTLPAKADRIKVVKPVAPAPQPKYRVSVQLKPKFAPEKRPAASQPAVEKGLSVTIQPERTKFAGNGPLAFEVVLKNVSDKTFLLYGAEVLGRKAKLVISNLKTAAQWEPGRPVAGKDAAAVELPPGKSLKYTLVVDGVFAIPRPLPQPIPRPIPRPFPKRGVLEGKAGAAAGIVRRGPVVRPAPVFIGPIMPCGMGKCRARLLLEFNTDPRRRYRTPQWSGRIATAVVDFAVGKPQPIRPPVIVPPIVGPTTKQRAIKIAQAAAERALKANYKPLDPVRPPHQGAWIAESEKTANVKQQQGGGWRVGWTHVPKGKGFTYIVTILVGPTGAASVREVFTGYSPR